MNLATIYSPDHPKLVISLERYIQANDESSLDPINLANASEIQQFRSNLFNYNNSNYGPCDAFNY